MLARRTLSPAQINTDLLAFVFKAPRWFWVAVALVAAVVGAGVLSEVLIVIYGLAFLGYTNTVFWELYISNFIFWVGISHAGVMISAILRLTEAEWRRPITRCAEVLAIFALGTAGIFPLIHTGRVWRTAYWIFPYDWTRNIWPDVRSALIWDPSAIVTYLTGTVLFVYIDLLPDLAVARDRAQGWKKTAYGLLSLGYRGTSRQWRIQLVAGQLLSAIILAVFVSVHSIVAWDLAMAILPGWHSTALAPYFVIGAVHSGVAAVVTAMASLRRALHLEDYITHDHFDIVGRLEIAVALGYFFYVLCDIYFGLFKNDPVEVAIWELRFFSFPTNALFGLQILTTLAIPLPLWLLPRVRRNPAAMFWISIVVNIGMFTERYLLVVNPLSLKQAFTFLWMPTFVPHWPEYVMTAGAVAIVAGGLITFAKIFPIVPLWDFKEGQVLKETVRVGRARLPATSREPEKDFDG